MSTTRIMIAAPIWGSKSVGVAEWRMTADVIEVNILYTDKKGRKVFPHIYRMSRARAMTYPTQTVAGGTKLRVIPIAAFEEIPQG